MGDDNALIFMSRDNPRNVLLVSPNHQVELFTSPPNMSVDVFFDQMVEFMEARNGDVSFAEARTELLRFCPPREMDEQALKISLIDALFQMFNASIQDV